MIRCTHATSDTTINKQHAARRRESSSSFLGDSAGGGLSLSLDCSREIYAHRTCRNAILSALGDGGKAFQMSDNQEARCIFCD